MVSTYLFDTCTHKCGYCWLAESGMVLDAGHLAPFRDDAFICRVTSFFNRRTTETEKWTLQLTGGEPLLMPNLPAFCEQLFEYGNRALDVCFYPTTLFSPTYPSAYSEEQQTSLARHFSSNAQRIQLEGGIAIKGILCNSGSLNLALRFPSGDFTPCISTFQPVLGNLFEDRLALLPGPAPCPDQKIVCSCDIHFQQDIIPIQTSQHT